MRRAAIIVLDGLGIGPAHDAKAYGDAGSNTLGNVARQSEGFRFPRLEGLGLGRCATVPGLCRVRSRPGQPTGCASQPVRGRTARPATGKSAACCCSHRFPRTRGDFPRRSSMSSARRTGRGVLGNKPASGTAVLDEYGAEHRRTGSWIVYTSADSVFQIAAHEATSSAARALCGLRNCAGDPRGRARRVPGHRSPLRGAARRLEADPAPPRLQSAATGSHPAGPAGERQIPRVGVGKVDDLFAGGASAASTPRPTRTPTR